MNSLERAMAAIKHENVDRPPVDLHNFQMGAEASGCGYDRYMKNGKLMAESHIEQWKRFGHDMILHENGTAALAEAVGCKVEYSKDKSPIVVRSVLESITDVTKLKSINVTERPIIQELLIGTDILLRELGDDVLVMGRSDQGPFSLAGLMLGMDVLMLELGMQEHIQELELLMEYCIDVTVQYAKAQLKAGCLVTSIGESLAGPDLISPPMYRKFAAPYEKIVADEVHSAGGLLALHICGDTTKIIADMISTGADILEIDEKSDLPNAVSLAVGKTCLLGNIAPKLFRTGTPQEIETATRQLLSDMKAHSAGSGFIVGPGCALAGDTPYENIETMITVVHHEVRR